MKASVQWLLAATAVLSCQMPALELTGRACPCGGGWSCDEEVNRCVPLESTPDTDVPNDADTRELGDSDQHVPRVPCDWSMGVPDFNVEPADQAEVEL